MFQLRRFGAVQVGLVWVSTTGRDSRWPVKVDDWEEGGGAG